MLDVARNPVGRANGRGYLFAFHGREMGRMAPLFFHPDIRKLRHRSLICSTFGTERGGPSDVENDNESEPDV